MRVPGGVPRAARLWLVLFALAVSSVDAGAQAQRLLPDAPVAAAIAPPESADGQTARQTAGQAQTAVPSAPASTSLSDSNPVMATRSNTPEAVERRHWSEIVEPGEVVPELSVRDKLLFPAHEEFRIISLFPAVLSAGYGIVRDSDPRFGVDSAGFGERVGAAALRQGTTRLLSDGVLPTLFHEDPRYYRRAVGHPPTRLPYAATRIFIARKDDGTEGFNYSDTLGRLFAACLTQAYYPDASLGAGVVVRTWGFSLAALAATHMFQEYVPDIERKLHLTKLLGDRF